MGVLDDILGGDEDGEREERQESIDRIREKVQGERGRREPDRSRSAPEPPITPDELETGGGEAPEPPRQREERGRDAGPERSGRGGQPQPAERRDTRQPSGGDTAPQRQPQTRREEQQDEDDRDTRRSPRGEPSEGPTHDDVPEPPELKDLDVPDIEKGPLFITVDKFRDALRAISDMRRVAADMEDYIGSMEGTLQEDRETEEGIRQILDEAEDDTERLKDIVSP
ncbi:MAG: hypothetical protein SVU88_01220 [Candidatus Nanohaloarchaea archaeon]|nr:hypothetical protein [Candidatus Nanohaloarchaea archaeon]